MLCWQGTITAVGTAQHATQACLACTAVRYWAQAYRAERQMCSTCWSPTLRTLHPRSCTLQPEEICIQASDFEMSFQLSELTMPAMEGSVWLCSRQVTAPMERPHRPMEESGNLPLRKATAAVRSCTSRAPRVTHSPSDSPEPCAHRGSISRT